MFKNLKIRTKILSTVAIVSLLVITMIVFAKISVQEIKNEMVNKVGETQIQGHKNLLKWEVHTIAATYAAAIKETKGDDKKIEVLRTLNNNVTFLENGSGYFFIYTMDGTNISLPLKRSLENKNLFHLKDPNGVEFVKDLSKCARDGGGYVEYLWGKSGEDPKKMFPKLSYSAMIEGTEWWIGTGVYIDDVEAQKAAAANEVDSILSRYTSIGLGIIIVYTMLVIIPGVLFFSNLIVRPLRQIRDVAQAAQEGDFSIDVSYESKDEVGAVATAFRKLAVTQRARAGIARAIAEGDLTVNPTAASDKDILGNALVLMAEKLNEIMASILTASEEVNSGAGQISTSSQALSDGATTSAASIQEISSSMAEIEAQIKVNADNATKASTLSGTAREAAETGSGEMVNMLSAMSGISESSQRIAKIIKVIDDIAFQTNLLALNAAVEAARAGSHGKGFAVVAEEVRNLAGRSAKAARETTELIEDAVKRVEHGNAIADKTGEALSGIVEQVTQVNDLVGEIASASQEQTVGVGQVTQGLEQIDRVTQNNTASAEETAAASEELSSQATELQHLIARFRLKSIGTSAAAAVTSRNQEAQPKPKLRSSSALTSDDRVSDLIISLDDGDSWGKY